ncbi:MAG: hypothetical protein HQK81_01495 [Desulfovibrionaceae bacterium]|nr:hypothetical protein [Desulfovibrionaceae bacterium]
MAVATTPQNFMKSRRETPRSSKRFTASSLPRPTQNFMEHLQFKESVATRTETSSNFAPTSSLWSKPARPRRAISGTYLIILVYPGGRFCQIEKRDPFTEFTSGIEIEKAENHSCYLL